MKYRVGACALLFVLAGCSGESPDSKLAAMHGTAATGAASKSLAPLPASRSAGKAIASAPDRGALVSYGDKASVKKEGAFTYYPVAISEDHALKAIVTGEMTVPAPDGSQVKLRYERHEESTDGNWTWVGRVVDGDQAQEALITFGEKAVFGSIPQPNGAPPLSLTTRGGRLLVTTMDPTKASRAYSEEGDMLVPTLAAKASASAASQSARVAQGAVAVAAAAPPTAANTVDVAVGFSSGLAARIGSDAGATTRMVNLVQVANQALSNSDVNGYFRLVRAVKVAHADTTANTDSLHKLTGNTGSGAVTVPAELAPLRTAREEYGADIAILVRDFKSPENDGCGIAWLNGADLETIDPTRDDDWAFAVVSDGQDQGTDGKDYYCADETLAHEAAHLMGSAHDRANSRNGTALRYGAFEYSFGYKTAAANGNFFTVMAYGDVGQTPNRIFSTPLKSICGTGGNQPCGVANSEDNARSLNQTISIVASFRNAVVPFEGLARGDVNGDSRSDIQWFNPATGVLNIWLMNGNALSGNFARSVSTQCTPRAFGDFNGDRRSDVTFTCVGDNTVYMWLSAGNAFVQEKVGNFSAGWILAGAADFNGDSRADLIWQHPATGNVNVWVMNGSALSSYFGRTISTQCSLRALGDTNGDGKADVTWTCIGDNSVYMWFSSGSAFSQEKVGNFSAGWSLVNGNDVDGNGKTDLLWYQASTGTLNVWLMNGTTLAGNFARTVSPACTPRGFGDYNGDGRGDVVWTCGGDNTIYLWNSTTNGYSQQFIGNYSNGWNFAY